ncbi:Tol-Pal system beta propeller repeat protein TolB [Gynuella sp.]|uniref:Tol-Pal system beta propeller repeat protein TolB n=1 Tax=Gynuella sp. TaxID=2969146 RepID=UPI003D0E44E9
MKLLRVFFAVSILAFATQALAEFKFVITRGYDKPTSIAVVPFCWNGTEVLPEQIASIVGSDFSRTGQFSSLAPENMLSQPCDNNDVYFRDWKLLKQDYLIIGQISQLPGTNNYEVIYRLYDVFREQNIQSAKVTGSKEQLRDLAHAIADSAYEKITGIRGVFSTKIAYVTLNKESDKSIYRLEVADADGYRAKTLYQSNGSIISVSWSSDAKKLAFTNFEPNGKTRIKIVDRFTRKVETLPAYPGINSGASFSPDGKTIAFVNSQTGNPDIYLMDLESKKITRITKHWSIDTEPSWSPDGKKLLFTSERGGRPQIYQVTLDTRAVERLTFEGIYNARAQYSSDGKYVVMVHQDGGPFHVAALDLATRQLRILTETDLDESPSMAPNGTMLVYATQNKGRGVLAWASVDGQLASIMPAVNGHVREPAWSPFIR